MDPGTDKPKHMSYPSFQKLTPLARFNISVELNMNAQDLLYVSAIVGIYDVVIVTLRG